MNVRAFILLPTSLLVALVAVFLFVPNALALLAFKSDSFLAGELWRILTYMFVHASPNHLFENVTALTVASLLAYEVEMTPWQYMIVLVASLFIVAIADLVYFPTLLLVGASSAIYAVYGAFAMKGSIFISRSWLVPILGATVWTKFAIGQLTEPATDGILAQTLLHFLGFASGVGMMMVCIEIAKATRRRVFA